MKVCWRVWVVTLVLAAIAVAQSSPEAKGLRTIGAIRSVKSNSITVAADSGEEVTASLEADTKIVRIAPGQKDLKDATPLRVEDLQVGDRVLVRGIPLSDGKTLKAAAVIVMKQADVNAKQERERADWQKRGVSGLVTAVDAGSGTVTISTGATAAQGASAKSIAVLTTKKTILRRYASNSIKYDDARPAPFEQIRVGDQLRARGERSADGSEITAEEVISGSFRNIAGLIASIDSAAETVTVQDLIAKKPVTVKIGADTTVKKLPAEIAQRIAMRLKGSPNRANGGAGNGGQTGRGQAPGGAGNGAGAAGGAPDLQRFLSRLPGATLTDLSKGDAVMIVSTEGGAGDTVNAVTVLAGVEPILTASPSASLLSSWSLGSAAAEGGGGQ